MKKKITTLLLLLPSVFFAQQLNIIHQSISVITNKGIFVITQGTLFKFNSSDKNLKAAELEYPCSKVEINNIV